MYCSRILIAIVCLATAACTAGEREERSPELSSAEWLSCHGDAMALAALVKLDIPKALDAEDMIRRGGPDDAYALDYAGTARDEYLRLTSSEDPERKAQMVAEHSIRNARRLLQKNDGELEKRIDRITRNLSVCFPR
tara:strand:+ start:292 stop:702 length:411 start_codon:yes stop_codon:yes gene_type:complete